MKKTYNIFLISKLYLKQYYKFLLFSTDICDTENAISLFVYSIKRLYGLDSYEFSDYISRYGEECISYLGGTLGTPVDEIEGVSFEDRVRVVSVCEAYARAVSFLKGESIVNARGVSR